MHVRVEKLIKIDGRNLKEKDQSQDLSVDGKVILDWILGK
jgi:hypothetical protein